MAIRGIIAGRLPEREQQQTEPKLVLFVINVLLENRLSATNAQPSVHHRTYVLSKRKSATSHLSY